MVASIDKAAKMRDIDIIPWFSNQFAILKEIGNSVQDRR
jgi:hypothetical protein